MKKVKHISWHTLLIDTLKTETIHFALNPSLHLKPLERSEQCCSTFKSGLTEDKYIYRIMYIIYSIVSYHIVSYQIISYHIISCQTLYCIMLCYVTLRCTALHCIALHYIIILCYITLYDII